MAKLLYSLPPLSPDYSGVASIFHDLRALTVIHDASGCTGTYTGYDEPRWFGSQSPVFCSGIRDIDAIMGDDEKLFRKIESALKGTNAPCVAVIGSPVPMVIGFDYEGFAALVEHRTGVPCLAFDATGLSYYDEGQKAAYMAIAQKFLAPEKATPIANTNANTVNVLGASVLDGFNDETLDQLSALLRQEGLQMGAVWGMRSDLNALRETPKAQVNWVVTACALPLARFLKDRYGTPYVVGLALGNHEKKRIMNALKKATHGNALSDEEIFPPTQNLSSHAKAKTLIIGEGLFCASLRAKMMRDDGADAIKIGSLFSEGKMFLSKEDSFFASESNLADALKNPAFETIIADPLMADLLPRDSKARFIEMPHRAVSGRLYA